MSAAVWPVAAAAAPDASAAAQRTGQGLCRRRRAGPDRRCRSARRIADHEMAARAFALTAMRTAVEARSNQGPSTATSIMKNAGTKIAQDRHELTLEILGAQGLGWEGVRLLQRRAGRRSRVAVRQGLHDLRRLRRGPEQHHLQADSRPARPARPQRLTKRQTHGRTDRRTKPAARFRAHLDPRQVPRHRLPQDARCRQPRWATIPPPSPRWRRWAGPASSSPRNTADRISATSAWA